MPASVKERPILFSGRPDGAGDPVWPKDDDSADREEPKIQWLANVEARIRYMRADAMLRERERDAAQNEAY